MLRHHHAIAATPYIEERRRNGHGMDAVGARRARRFEHRVGVEVGRRRRRPAADLDRNVGELHVLGARASASLWTATVSRPNARALFMTSASYFSSIGYEEAFEVGEGHLFLRKRFRAFFSTSGVARPLRSVPQRF